ncbi:hypothetical protein [Streptomyces colonosanans]|uniref:Uncharacterized protein n=1 Tax=Streptomyces colonosanans TaxID=1428652 RepID=A0A1S2Q2X7_9ACTN|nr:hypothetical protein [Streptomyces colonosanans]OIK00133.1 hypothetical protein BIV24_03725 [Streptomyces colonosanans]
MTLGFLGSWGTGSVSSVFLDQPVASGAVRCKPEVDLSRALLSRLTEGAATMTTTPAAMSEWGRAWEGGSPPGAERERLLREWAG